MQSKTVAVVGGEVTGNIGSCSVVSTNITVSSFYKETVAVNSCTGQVVADNIWYYWSYVAVPVTIFVIICGFASFIKWLTD